MTAAIQARRFHQDRRENSRFSWLARNITSFTAAGYMIDKGKENKGLKMAAELAYDDIEQAALGIKPPPQAPKENGNGSFERFMGMMGQLDQRGKML